MPGNKNRNQEGILPLKEKRLKQSNLHASQRATLNSWSDPKTANVSFKLILALMRVTSNQGVHCQNPYDVTELFCKFLAPKTEKTRKKKKRTALFSSGPLSAESRLQPEWGGMISIKTGCCLKASSCQAELPLRHRHHNRGRPSHNTV